MEFIEQTKYLLEQSKIWKINKKNIEKTYQSLIDNITDHNHLYYIENNPIISDYEYDILFNFLKKIEEYYPNLISSNSPTQKLIWQNEKNIFSNIKHKKKLLSLENSYNENDIIKRYNNIKKNIDKDNVEIIIEPKFDWLAVEVIYKDWKIYKAITRWDWYIWEDITNNVKMINNIPMLLKWENIKWTFSFRWEILVSISQFKNINENRKKKWETQFANTRNLASWTIKLLDSNKVKERWLTIFFYEILYISNNKKLEQEISKKQDKNIDIIKKLWLPVFERHKKTNKLDELIKICNKSTKKILSNFDFDFDWLVIKTNNINYHKIIWTTNHHPKRAIAYKFPAEQIATKIESVDYQIWRTWVITPVANVTKIKLSWVEISRISLHNFDFIKNKNIYLNDYVLIQRSWEVIPYILNSIEKRRWKNFNLKENKINPPKHCPICWTKTIRIDVNFFCPNTNCKAQIKERLIYFVNKECMNIEWIWKNIINLLVEKKILTKYLDIYQLTNWNTRLQIHSLPWFWNKKIFEIEKQLEKSKEKPLRRIINALWIPWLWNKMSKQIHKELKKYYEKKNIKDTFENFLIAIQDEVFLKNIFWLWEKLVKWIVTYIKTNKKTISDLYNVWINFSPFKYDDLIENNIKWSFCITWSFNIQRQKIIEQFQSKWYFFSKDVTKNIDFLIIWKKPWNKLNKAKKLWIKIYNQKDVKKIFKFIKLENPSKKTIIKKQSLF